MTQNRQLGDLAQIVTVNTAASSIQVGNTSIHSDGVTVGNTSIYTTGIIVDGQNINTTSFPGTANNTSFVGSVSAANVVSNAQLQANVTTLQSQITSNVSAAYSNSISYTDGKIATANAAITGNAASAYSNATAYVDGKSYVNTSQFSSNLSNYQTTAGLASNVASLTANNTSFVGTVAAANVVSNTQLQANVTTLQSQITSNSAAAYSNAVSYTDSRIATANSAITGNAATAYSNAITFASNASNINTGTIAEARLPYRMDQNVRTTDAVTFQNITVSGNLTVSGSTISLQGNTISFTDNMIYLNQGISATITNITGNGTYVTFTANNNYSAGWDVAVSNVNPSSYNGTYQNIFSANATHFVVANNNTASYVSGGTARGKTDANPDLGIAAGYNDGTYHHAGIFRDASDGIWKVFEGYDPEPDASIFIDTTNTSFQFSNFQANTFFAGNTSSNWFVANTTGAYHTGLVNAASYRVGTSFTANSTLTNTVSLVVSTNTATIGTGTYFVSNGNVGIGTTSPGYKLDVSGIINTSDQFRASGGGGDVRLNGNYGGTTAVVGTVGSTGFGIMTSNDPSRLWITSGGDIGVNTTSPYGKFTVRPSTNNTSITLSGGDPATGAWIRNDGSNMVISTNVGEMYYGFSGSSKNLYFMPGGSSSGLTIGTDRVVYAPVQFRTPIFYDYDNTAYYVDPNSTSFIHRLTIKPTDGDTTLRLYQYGGTSSSPSEIADWPHPVVSIRSFGDFYLQSMLSFGLPGDADYKTDDSVWNFKLNGVRSGGWDNNTGTSKTTTDSGVGLQLLGPGRLRIGSVNANDTYIRYNGIDLVRVSSMGGISGLGVKNGDGWSGLALSSDSNKTVVLHYGASNDYALRFGRYSNNFGNWEANPFNMYMNDGYATASNSWRSPIFYDLDNTGYYVDPNSTSNIVKLITSSRIVLPATNDGRTNGLWHWGDSDSNWVQYMSQGTAAGGVNPAGGAAANGYWNNGHAIRVRAANWIFENYGDNSARAHIDTTGAWFAGQTRSPIYYDSNDTAYYCDPNSVSRFWRLNIIEWIHFDGYTGLYSPNNGAHFYPNNASYGSWRIAGSRNGWSGIEFDSVGGQNVSLMMNSAAQGFHNNSVGWRFYVESGNAYFPGNVAAYWSDRRLKENLRPIGKEASDILSKLTAYRFNWNDKVTDFNIEIQPGKEEIGLIAQEVQSILPDAVQVNKSANKVNNDGDQEETDYLTITWNKITPLIVQALNDTTRELNELKQLLKDKGVL